ncbi:MAG TPA: type II secretion system protein GspM [Rhodopila sp.]|uniref:type II secretion system protein GspM n=1 Tax=Rhodopila sp. TaxID=2480087 RepID=UPI002C4F2560|nr:type II secretion system protein GspM [Rhodopila sp.]HVY15973.1 type II secretion system protein GspM [Rhodopila sp.]
MMTDAWLTGVCGRALAIGATVLALGLVWFGVVAPAHTFFEDRAATLARREMLLRHMRQMAMSLPALREAAARHGSGDSDEGLVVPGNTDALAAARLQEQVQRMATAAGASLTTVETLPTVSTGSWRRISLRISLTAPWSVLIGLLRSIHQGPTRILVDDLHVQATLAAKPTAAEPVQASVTLYGFRSSEQSAMR